MTDRPGELTFPINRRLTGVVTVSDAEVAEAVAFLVSEKAGYITGQTLIIDGGWTAISPSPYA